jgi:hypothetical protein
MIESASVIARRRLAFGIPAFLFCINDQNKTGAEAVAGTFISNFRKLPHANKARLRLSTRSDVRRVPDCAEPGWACLESDLRPAGV